MSIQSEIDRINGNVQDTISTIQQTGVSVPSGANSNNLPSLAAALANTKQDKLTGHQGQVVGFDAEGNAVAQAAPSGGITQEEADDRYLKLAGGTMTGAIAMGGNKITGLAAPTKNADAARKQDVDAKANINSPTFTGTPKAPSSATDYTTARIRNIRASTTDLTAGSSSLNSGELYFVYE